MCLFETSLRVIPTPRGFAKPFPGYLPEFLSDVQTFKIPQLQNLAKEVSLESREGNEKKKNPCVSLFSLTQPFFKNLTAGWKSRLIGQESLTLPPTAAAVFRCLRAAQPSERTAMKSQGERSAAHNATIICPKFHPPRRSLHNSRVIRSTVFPLKA